MIISGESNFFVRWFYNQREKERSGIESLQHPNLSLMCLRYSGFLSEENAVKPGILISGFFTDIM